MEENTSVSGEVVEIYRQPGPSEVVEIYSRPLPGAAGKRRPAPPPPPEIPKKKPKTGFWIFLACVAVTACLAVALTYLTQWYGAPPSGWDSWDGPYYHSVDEDDYQDQPITIPTWPTGLGARLTVERRHGEELTSQEIYRQVNPSVVGVLAGLDEDTMSVGTGVIFSPDGYVLTNYHVVAGGTDCTVLLDSGRGYDAMYVAGDAENDLAVLKVSSQDLPAAGFGDSDLLTVGDKVYAIGNPLGMELRGTFTDGIVSAINRDVRVQNRVMTLIQTNAALNSGNSGGPLINQYGQVVGINTIKMTSDYSNVEGLGFAIPSASIDRLVNDLLSYGAVQPEPVLGVTVSTVSEEVAPGLWGIQVQSVTGGSAADQAGVRQGDYIVSAAGEAVESSRDLLRARRQCHLGDKLALTLWRDGETLDVTLLLLEAAE